MEKQQTETPCAKNQGLESALLDTDVNNLGAHVRTSGSIIMVTKAVFIYC